MLSHLGVWSGVAGLAVALIFGVGPHMGFKMSPWLARAGFVTGIILLAVSPLIFAFHEREPGAGTAITTNGNSNCIVGGTSNQVTCGLPGPATTTSLPKPTAAFKENAAPSYYLFSIACMTFRPIGKFLEGIESGQPTPFITMMRGTTSTPLISLYAQDDKKLYADVTLFSPLTGQAFVLKKDTFSRYAPWDVNYNDRAIEVVDQNETPIFHLIRETDTILRIDGLLRMKDSILFLGRGGTYVGVLLGKDANNYVPPPDFLPKIFKYQSWKYQGEYADAGNPQPQCTQISKDGIFAMSAGLIAQAPDLP